MITHSSKVVWLDFWSSDFNEGLRVQIEDLTAGLLEFIIRALKWDQIIIIIIIIIITIVIIIIVTIIVIIIIIIIIYIFI